MIGSKTQEIVSLQFLNWPSYSDLEEIIADESSSKKDIVTDNRQNAVKKRRNNYLYKKFTSVLNDILKEIKFDNKLNLYQKIKKFLK